MRSATLAVVGLVIGVAIYCRPAAEAQNGSGVREDIRVLEDRVTTLERDNERNKAVIEEIIAKVGPLPATPVVTMADFGGRMIGKWQANKTTSRPQFLEITTDGKTFSLKQDQQKAITVVPDKDGLRITASGQLLKYRKDIDAIAAFDATYSRKP